MDEHRQGVATNGARAESRSEQGWGKDRRYLALVAKYLLPVVVGAAMAAAAPRHHDHPQMAGNGGITGK